MDRIEFLANSIVQRGVGFTFLAIGTVMLGLSFDLLLCFKTGAILETLHGAVLAVFAYKAPRWNHRSTELWVRLNKGADLPANYPPEQLLEVLRRTYTRYAEVCAITALVLTACATIIWIVR